MDQSLKIMNLFTAVLTEFLGEEKERLNIIEKLLNIAT